MKRLICLVVIFTSLLVPSLCGRAQENQTLDPTIGTEIVIEAGQTGFSTQGNWASNSSLLNPSGATSWFTTSQGATATYKADLEPGTYEVYYWRLSHSERNDTALEVNIAYDGKQTDKTVSFEGSGNEWVLLDSYYFSADGDEYVQFKRTQPADSAAVTRTGAVKFVKTGSQKGEAVSSAVDVKQQLLQITGVSEGIEFKKGQAPTRAELVKMAMAVIGVGAIKGSGNPMFVDVTAEHPYYGIIAAAIDCGIINGDENGNFRAEDPVSKNEAIKIIAGALGYGLRAQIKGGYPTGYSLIAVEIGLLDGVREPFDDEAAKTLIYNALMAEAVNDSDVLRTEGSRRPVIEEYHGLYHGAGVVNGIKNLSLTDEAAPAGSQARIGNELFEDPDGLAEEWLGQRVSYYYRKEPQRELALVYSKTQRNVLEISENQIDEISVSGSAISVRYDDAAAGIKKVNMASGAKVLYNGQLLTPPYSQADFELSSGLLRFVSSDGGNYDLLFVYSYDVYVVNTANRDAKKVFPKYRADVLDLSSAGIADYKIIRETNGKEADIGDLKEWNVLNVMARHHSQPSGSVNISLTNKKVSGEVTEISANGYLTIGAKQYKIAQSFMPYASGLIMGDSTLLGETITAYMDMSGNIVAADISKQKTDNVVYGYRITGLDGGMDKEITLKVFTTDGVWEELKLCDAVEYNGVKMKAADIVSRSGGLINLTKFDEMIHKDAGEHVILVSQGDKVSLTGSWATSTADAVLGPTNEGTKYSADKAAIATYDASSIPAGMYGLYYYRIVYASSTDGIDVTVNSADGVYTTRLNELTAGEGRGWEFLGNFEFNGAGNVSFQLSADSKRGDGGTSVQRTAAIKFGEPILSPKEPTDYITSLALPVERPIYIEKNTEGKIRKIDTLTPGTGFSRWVYYSSNKAFVESAGREKVGFTAASDTVIFGIPPAESDLDSYQMSSLSTFITESGYTAQSFDLDEKLKAQVMLVRVGGDLRDDVPECVLVTDVGSGINSEGTITTLIRGYQSGTQVSYIGADSETFKGVKPGDMIIASKNKKGDTASNTGGYQILYSYENRTPGQTGGNLHSDYCIAYGKITQVYDGGSVAKIDIGSEQRIYYLNGANVYTYNADKGIMSIADMQDISVDDDVLVRIRRGGAREVVLYR